MNTNPHFVRTSGALVLVGVVVISSIAGSAVWQAGGSPRSAITVALVAFAAGLLLAFFYISSRISSEATQEIAEAARRVAEGDLEHRMPSSSSAGTQELAAALNSMADKLQEIISEVSVERARLSTVLDTMADGVMVVDRDSRISLINRAAEQLLRTGPNPVSRSLQEIVRDHELQEVVSEAADGQQPCQAEVQLLYGGGYVRALATPVAGAELGGVLLTLHDMTELRQLETTRKEFVTNVSHELRNPLAAAKLMVETLETGALEDPPTAMDFLGRLNGEIDRMAELVEELLELARLESGQTGLHLAPFDLTEMLAEVRESYQPRAERTGIRLSFELENSLPWIVGEKQKLRQVVANLLDNALKFTPAERQVTVSAAPRSRYVDVSVADTGPGIAPEHVPHVFERFYKADRSRHDEGSGLGLAIAKHIVLAHGGHVDVKSSEGEGTEFTVRLPRAD